MNTSASPAIDGRTHAKLPRVAVVFGLFNLLACLDALTLGVVSLPPVTAYSYRASPSVPVDGLFLLTLNVRFVGIVMLLVAGVGLLCRKSWGRSFSIAYAVSVLGFLLIHGMFGGRQNIYRPPVSGDVLWLATIYPIALLIGMLRYAGCFNQREPAETDSTGGQKRPFRFARWYFVVPVIVVSVVTPQIVWWIHHPIKRELFKLKHGGRSVQRSAAVALGEMGSDAKQAVPTLINAMNEFYHYDVAMALSKIGTVPALVALLQHDEFPLYPNPFWPVPALGRYGPEASEAVPVLIELLESPSGRYPTGHRVRMRGRLLRDVAHTLGQIGPKAKAAIPALTAIPPNPHGRGTTSEQYQWRYEWKAVCGALRQIGLEHLEGNTEIDSLFFVDYDQPLTDMELAHLKGLTGLRQLGLRGAAITDDGLVHLQRMTNLEALWLGGSGTQITDKGLEHLAGLTKLKHLEIWSPHVTDTGIEYLKGLTSLETLHFISPSVSNAGRRELREALPKCLVTPGHHDPMRKPIEDNPDK